MWQTKGSLFLKYGGHDQRMGQETAEIINDLIAATGDNKFLLLEQAAEHLFGRLTAGTELLFDREVPLIPKGPLLESTLKRSGANDAHRYAFVSELVTDGRGP